MEPPPSGDDEVILDIRSMEEHDDKPLVVEGRGSCISPSSSWPPPLVICRKRRPTCSHCDRGVMSKLQALYLKEKGFANVKVYRP